jgi:hypothetical protein
MSQFDAELLEFFEAKVDNALSLCYNDSRQKAVDVLLDLKNELRNVRNLIHDEEELATSL